MKKVFPREGNRGLTLRWLPLLPAALLAAALLAGCGSGSGDTQAKDSDLPGDEASQARMEEVVAFVEEAVEYANASGKEAALAEFSDPNGSFKRGELYIYAYDFTGTVLAHGGDAGLIGRNIIDYEDPNGVKVIQGLIDVARGGEGWFSYTWENPETGEQEPKLGYVMKVDDSWWLGSGTYEEVSP